MENLLKAIAFRSGGKQHKNHPRIKTEAQRLEGTRHGDDCVFGSSMLGHGASRHGQSKHHSHARAFKRTDAPAPTTPREPGGRGEQMEGTRGAGPAPLGMSNTSSRDIRGNRQIRGNEIIRHDRKHQPLAHPRTPPRAGIRPHAGLSSNTRGGPCATYHSREDAPPDCPPACERIIRTRWGTGPPAMRRARARNPITLKATKQTEEDAQARISGTRSGREKPKHASSTKCPPTKNPITTCLIPSNRRRPMKCQPSCLSACV